jgi:hypothetical protein
MQANSEQDFFLRNIDGKSRNDLKDDETRELLFFKCCNNDVDDGDDVHVNDRLLLTARSKLWFKWSGAELIQCNFPAGYAKSMLNDESGVIVQEKMRFLLDITEHEIDKDLSRTFSDSELRERFQVRLVESRSNLSLS